MSVQASRRLLSQPQASASTREQGRTWIRAAITGVLYLVVARYALSLREVITSGTGFWPAAGVTLTALTVSPRRMWVAILLAVGVAELVSGVSVGSAVVPALWWSAANIVSPAAVALTLQRLRATAFEDVTATVRFMLTVLVVPIVGGLIGVIGSALTGPEASYLAEIARWTLGDAIGMLTIAPLGILLLREPSAWRRLRSLEAFGVSIAVIVGTLAAFWDWGTASALPLLFLALPPMMWAALRLRVTGAALAVFLVAQIAHVATAIGSGVIAATELPTGEVGWLLQLYLATLGSTALIVGSRTDESAENRDLAEARERLISVISHELRTPLTPIIGFSELALRRHPDLPDDVRDALIIIKRNGEHLVSLVDDVLTVTRARRGQLVTVPQATDLMELLTEVVDDLDLDVEVPSPLPDGNAWVDRGQLKQVVTNLLGNAEAHGRPPVRIQLTTTATELVISVSDAGDGVPTAFVPELFQDFSQAMNGDRRTSSGLGLGLAISRELIAANQGRISYLPEHPHGARFVVTLPRTTPSGEPPGTTT